LVASKSKSLSKSAFQAVLFFDFDPDFDPDFDFDLLPRHAVLLNADVF